ncbi:MAG: hypothetical protein ACJ74Q_15460 [Pyrinomonadaceae bacterium]
MMGGRKRGALPVPTEGEKFGMAVAGWAGVVLYVFFRWPVERAALGVDVVALAAGGARGAELWLGFLRVMLDHGFNIFMMLVLVFGGAIFLAYRGLILSSIKPGQPFTEFVKDCFISGGGLIPAAVARRVLPRKEVRRREMMAETFLAMACGAFHVERDGARPKLLAVEDAANEDQGRIWVGEAVMRSIAEGILPVLPQYSDDGRVSFRLVDQSIALVILAEAFGLGPAPLSLKAAAGGTAGLRGGRVVETWPAPPCHTR